MLKYYKMNYSKDQLSKVQSNVRTCCPTCGKQINGLHKRYLLYKEDLKKRNVTDIEQIAESNIKIFKELGLKRYCCKMHVEFPCETD